MRVGDILKLFMIIIGIVLLWATVSSLAKRKITESVSLAWGMISLICILAGILLQPYGVSSYVSKAGLILIMLIVVIVLQAAFFVSIKLSELARKNHELALQVSLLIHENRNMQKHLEELEEKLKETKENQ